MTLPAPNVKYSWDGTQLRHPGVRVATPAFGQAEQRYELDHDMLYEAAKTHASYDHLARIFGIPVTVLQHEPYTSIIETARADIKQQLLAAQFNNAIAGKNAIMQIWLGKQYLDQKDSRGVEVSGPNGKPVQQEHTVKAVAYIPDNGRDRPSTPPGSPPQLPASTAP